MKKIVFGLSLFLAAPAVAEEPDGLILPPGFHASVVAEGLGPLRHMAVRPNGDIYASTGGEGGKPEGLVAIELGPDGKAARVEHFSNVNGGTGIGLYHGMLYAASGTAIYRFKFQGGSLLPDGAPDTVVADLPRGGNHAIAFDDSGHLFVGLGAKSNACSTRPAPDAKPVGQKPCPDLTGGGGIWRFDAARINQGFADGTQVATGIRFMTAMDWSPRAGLYGIMHGRDGTHAAFPEIVSATDDDAISDEMHHVVNGTDFGWPYSYYDGVRKMRLLAPDYGGDGKMVADGNYSTPAVTFQPMRAAPVALMFYQGKQFPAQWRGGAFIALHGTNGPQLPGGRNGYAVAFLPFDRSGKPGALKIFADGFAGPSPADKNTGKAAYRPVGLGVAPDGALYVADSNKGRIWRIRYGD
ncbi:MAG TPA: PQQ-dependent sugar dehydrogenase [Rhizomicrobium sp.]|nr:PQQ-dependent sugar dehydrogenase [Rhizomicrobium sp.]